MSDQKPPRPGEIQIGEPEFVGAFPVRTELTVLPADPPGRAPLGWTVSCYQGTEVFKEGAPETPLTRLEDIRPGDKLIVTTLVGRYLMTATLDEQHELFADSEGMVADLQFDMDDRHCWVSTYGVNKRAFAKLSGRGGSP
jgi:hypothetical protein